MTDHREDKLWGTLIFRKNGRECSRDKATEVRVKGHAYTDDIWLPWPENEALVKMIDQVGKAAYLKGQSDMRMDFRRLLGIEEDTDHEGNTTVRLG